MGYDLIIKRSISTLTFEGLSELGKAFVCKYWGADKWESYDLRNAASWVRLAEKEALSVAVLF